MEFLYAFLIGGGLCLVAQILLEFTPLDPPKILAVFLTLGGILTPFGISDALGALGGGGFIVMICGAGNAIATAAHVAVMGDPFMAIVLGLLFAGLVCLGCVFGAAHVARNKNDAKTGSTEASKSSVS